MTKQVAKLWGDGNGRYKEFKVTESDAPFMQTLKYTSHPQYHLLMLTQGKTWRSYHELAIEVGCPVNTVRTRLHRARAKIIKWREAEANKAL